MSRQLNMVGWIIKAHRKRLNLSVRSAALIAGVNYNTWLDIEKGKYRFIPKLVTINKICSLVGIYDHTNQYRAIQELYQVHRRLIKRKMEV